MRWVVLEGLEAAASREIPAVSPRVAVLVELRPVMAVVDHLLDMVEERQVVVDHPLGMVVEQQVAVVLLQDMEEAHQGVVGHRPVTEVAVLRAGSV